VKSQTSGRKPHKATLLLIFVSLLAIYNSNLHTIFSGDSKPAKVLPLSILLAHDVYLDWFAPNVLQGSNGNGTHIYAIVHRRGHWVSVFPIVTPILITPLYIPLAYYLTRSHLSLDSYQFQRLLDVMEKLSASIITSLSAVFLYLCLVRLTDRRSVALGLTFIYALASETWVISSQALWAHGMTELLIGLALWLLLIAETNPAALFGVGLALSLNTANRPANVILGVLLSLYVLRAHGWQSWRFFVPPALIAPLYLWYNFHFLGMLSGETMDGGFSTPLAVGLAGVLFSPSRGLFIYTPWVLFSCWGIIAVFAASRERTLYRYLALAVIGETIVYAKYYYWWGGWCFGPRYFADLMPILTILLIPIFKPLMQRSVLKYIFISLVTLSFGVQVVGAYFRFNLEIHPNQLWSWRDSQLVDAIKTHSLAMWSPRHSRLLHPDSHANGASAINPALTNRAYCRKDGCPAG
jgi:hypothetical protein